MAGILNDDLTVTECDIDEVMKWVEEVGPERTKIMKTTIPGVHDTFISTIFLWTGSAWDHQWFETMIFADNLDGEPQFRYKTAAEAIAEHKHLVAMARINDKFIEGWGHWDEPEKHRKYSNAQLEYFYETGFDSLRDLSDEEQVTFTLLK